MFSCRSITNNKGNIYNLPYTTFPRFVSVPALRNRLLVSHFEQCTITGLYAATGIYFVITDSDEDPDRNNLKAKYNNWTFGKTRYQVSYLWFYGAFWMALVWFPHWRVSFLEVISLYWAHLVIFNSQHFRFALFFPSPAPHKVLLVSLFLNQAKVKSYLKGISHGILRYFEHRKNNR